jgi:hypothetical protein
MRLRSSAARVGAAAMRHDIRWAGNSTIAAFTAIGLLVLRSMVRALHERAVFLRSPASQDCEPRVLLADAAVAPTMQERAMAAFIN